MTWSSRREEKFGSQGAKIEAMTLKTSRQRSSSRASGAASRRTHRRRLEVQRVLAGRGLLRGPRRLRAGGGPLAAEDAIFELRAALEQLGPVFAAFGRYLAGRADLLPATDCLVLEGTGGEPPQSHLATVDRTLRQALGRPRAEVFPVFEEQPFATRWLDQAHRAWTEDGERVVVRVIHARAERDLEGELEALAVLQGVFTDLGITDSGFGADHFARVLADFRRAVVARLTLEAEAEGLEVLGRDARRSSLLVVPRVVRELSTATVLTTEWLPGSVLDQITGGSALPEIDADDLARRIGLIWLQMALAGRRFPLEADVVELPDGRLAVTGGRFAALSKATRVRQWSYLRATVEHFPDRAAANLLHEVSKVRPDAVAAELRTRIRQVVPFRDGAWSTSGESLGEYAVLHWRALRAAGFAPRRELDEFYQGLFWAARVGRRLAPEKDPLGEAVRDFDWLAGWNQLRQLTAPRQAGATFESTLEALVELPQKIDRILSLATGEGFSPPAPRRPARRGAAGATVAVISLCLAMVVVVLLAGPWHTLSAAMGLSAAWAERTLALVFLGLGLMLLKAVGGGES